MDGPAVLRGAHVTFWLAKEIHILANKLTKAAHQKTPRSLGQREAEEERAREMGAETELSSVTLTHYDRLRRAHPSVGKCVTCRGQTASTETFLIPMEITSRGLQ